MGTETLRDALRCDGGCGYTTNEGKFGNRCPGCDFGVLVENDDDDD